jgi:carboxyl-terminal processing protease
MGQSDPDIVRRYHRPLRLVSRTLPRVETWAMKIQIERRFGALLIAFLSGALVSLLGTVFLYQPPRVAPNKEKAAFGIDDKDILLYLEAITHIKEKASSLSPDTSRARIVEQSLRAYLSHQELCCDYLTRDEFRRFKESLNESYVGIGMEIKQDRDGRIICLPQPESPAARAGIAPGDQLRSIGGVSVEGKSIFAVAAMARGKPGSQVIFTIATKGGAEKQVKLTRSAVALQSVSMRVVDRNPVIGVSHFTRDTSAKLREVLQRWERGVPIIIDLRGNGGGDLHAAIDSAMLLLKEGKRIVTVQTRKGTNTFESRAGAVNLTTPVYLWQDEGTASAAEVFIAALIDNDRAVSIGKRTAGKGTREEIIELSDGSALILATGNLQSPRGFSYQGKGLNPAYEMKDGQLDALDYLMKVRELSGAKKTGQLRRAREWRTAAGINGAENQRGQA